MRHQFFSQFLMTKDGLLIKMVKNYKFNRHKTGFMKIDVPEGEGTITLSFIPKGFIAGASCSLIAIIVFIFYDFQRKKYSR